MLAILVASGVLRLVCWLVVLPGVVDEHESPVSSPNWERIDRIS